MFKKNAIIIGASKGLGKALAEVLAKSGYNLILVSRNKNLLDILADDLRYRFGGTYSTMILDIESANVESIKKFLSKCLTILPRIDDLFLTAGQIINNDIGTDYDDDELSALYKVNFSGAITILSVFIGYFEDQKKGKVWVFTSIAVDAPRSRNVVYGAAKSGLDYYCRAMHHRLQNSVVELRLIRLGYIDTDMTKGKNLLIPAASKEKVANAIIKKMNKKFTLLYFPFYWRWLTFILKLLPKSVYNKLKF
jgi:decaprenylphospho-beta-D-erythro-pentofuranosid-2-ulose 2-reductase